MNSGHHLAFLVLLVLSAPQDISAQDINAQEILRQQERERALREQLERHPEVRGPDRETDTGRIPDGESPCFLIREVRLNDPSGDFGWAAAAVDEPENDPVTGRCLGSRGIQRAIARVQNALVNRGYVTTRVLVQEQDMKSGILALEILPGRLHAIRFTDDSNERAKAWNAFPAASGDILNLRDTEQALENWKRLPTAETDIRIEPGSVPGESDLVVSWKQAFPFRLTLSANDGGSRTTGKYQGSLTVSGDHLLALNDVFYATLSHDLGGGQSGSRGTRGHTLHYSLPFGYWMLAATGSAYRYHQSVAGTYQDYVYSGLSKNQEIKLSRVIYRGTTDKTTAHLRGYLNQSQNFVDDTEVEVQRRRMAGWEAGLGHRAFLADATLDLYLSWRRGTGASGALKAPEEPFGEGTARPRILSAEASFSLPFWNQRLHYTGLWRAQWNRSPLVPQDRFSIGGRYTVRGFDGESVLMAERGFLIRNDIAAPLGKSGQQIYIGLDHGQVGGHSASRLVGRHLTGSVAGLRGAWKGVQYDVFAGRPVRQPVGFGKKSATAGFSLTASF